MPLKRNGSTIMHSSGSNPVAKQRNQERTGAVATQRRQSEGLAAFGAPKQSDLVMPRLKLLQGMSPEVKNDPRNMIQGEFYHTGIGEMLGPTLKFVPIKQTKTFDLWAERESNEGLLAQADEDGNWLPGYANREFIINRRKINTRGNMEESGLNRFGSSDPNNPRSKPLMAETYRMVIWLIDFPHASPVMFITSRMGALKTKELLTRVMYREGSGQPVHSQVFEMISTLERYKSNEYFAAYFVPAGQLDDAQRVNELYSMAVGLGDRKIKTEDDYDQDSGPRVRADVDASDKASY